jgi:hypothetical protein
MSLRPTQVNPPPQTSVPFSPRLNEVLSVGGRAPKGPVKKEAKMKVTPYILWMDDEVKELDASGVVMTPMELMRHLKESWKELGEDEKAKYAAKALQKNSDE